MTNVGDGNLEVQIPPRVEPSKDSIGDVPIYVGPKQITLGIKVSSGGKSNYYVRQVGTIRDRYLGRFPLTDEGWRAAWGVFASADSDGARQYQAKLREPESPVRETGGSEQSFKREQTPSGLLILGALLGWGPWSAVIGVWVAYGNSGYTIQGHSASTSAVHGLCQAGQAALEPGICGSVDAHYTFGVAMLVVGVLAFAGGMIGIFVTQQHNPSAWRKAGGPIFAGLVLGIFAVVTMVIVAIVRSVRDGGASPGIVQAQPVITATPPQVPEQSSDPTTSTRQMDVQWRVHAENGWEWLASDGQWYSQHLAPAGLQPPAPPPPVPGNRAT